MKKILAVISIIAAFGIGGVSSASAGSCSNISMSTTHWDGSLYFNSEIGTCSGVNRVQMGGNGDIAQQDAEGYWWDGGVGAFLATNAYCTGNGTLLQTSPGSGSMTCSWHRPSWCGGAAHTVTTTFTYRIESIDIHGVKTWGPWHRQTSSAYAINC